VGRILADADPLSARGREIVRQQIARRTTATLLGIHPPRHIRALGLLGDRFGRAVALRCPYYLEETGSCGVWKHRNGTCATWFCKHQRGVVGRRFWMAVERLLLAIELALARHAALVLDPGPEALARLQPPPPAGPQDSLDDSDETISDDLHRARWGRWAGEEERYYLEASRVVDAMSAEDVMRVGGSEVALLSRLVVHAFAARANDDLPEQVRLVPLEHVRPGRGSTRVVAYSRFDPLDLPTGLLELLPALERGALAEARAALAEDEGVELDDALVRRLLDFGVLASNEPR
jgi:hypothetical protein